MVDKFYRRFTKTAYKTCTLYDIWESNPERLMTSYMEVSHVTTTPMP